MTFDYPKINYENLIDFLNMLSIKKQDEIIDSTEIEEITTHEDFEKKCLNNGNKPCVIALFDMSREGRIKYDLEKLKNIRKIYADKDYTFLKIDFKCHREISQLFRLSDTQ